MIAPDGPVDPAIGVGVGEVMGKAPGHRQPYPNGEQSTGREDRDPRRGPVRCEPVDEPNAAKNHRRGDRPTQGDEHPTAGPGDNLGRDELGENLKC